VHGKRVVFYTWLSIDAQYPPELNRAFNPGSSYGYIFNALTLPELRGRRIAPAGWLLACERARVLGCRRMLGWVEVRNEASGRALQRIGFEPRWRALRVSLFGRHWFLCRPLPVRRSDAPR